MRRTLSVVAFAIALASCSSSGGSTGTSVASVSVAVPQVQVVPGGTFQMVATAIDSAGNPISGAAFTWSSAPTAVATISSSGLVTGVSAGTATITATSGGKSGSAAIVVTPVGTSIGAAGGTVTSSDGKVTLVIPAGALTSATPISITTAAATAGDTMEIAGTTYNFGPSGTQFAKPVSVKILYDPAHLRASYPAGTAHVEVFQNGAWAPLDSGTVDTVAHFVKGSVTHFSPFRGEQYDKFWAESDESDDAPPLNPFAPLPTIFIGGVTVCDTGGTARLQVSGFGATAVVPVPVVTVRDPAIASAVVASDRINMTIAGKQAGATVVIAVYGKAFALVNVTVQRCAAAVPLGSTVVNGSLDNIDFWASGSVWITTTGGSFRYPSLGTFAAPPPPLRAALRVPRVTALAYRDASTPTHEAIYWDGFPGTATSVAYPGGIAPFGSGGFTVDNEFVFAGVVGSTSEVYGVPDHGSGATRLTALGGGFNNVVVSADSMIYFDWHPLNQSSHIYRMRLPVLGTTPPTTGQVQVTSSAFAETQPAISINRRLLAYTQSDATVTFARIYVIPVAATSPTPTLVSPATGFAFSPAWCGNGYLYYTYSSSSSGPYQVMRWDPAQNTSEAISRLSTSNVFELGVARTDGDGGVHRCPM